MIYEVMTIEAGLVCISSLLLFCPEILILEKECSDVIFNSIDYGFRALKNKYQAKLKFHFRLKTLHVMLLECFCWLPSHYHCTSSSPTSSSTSSSSSSSSQLSQQVFIEALRVFRDSVTTGYETSCLYHYVSENYDVLKYGAGQSAMISSNINSSIPLYTLEAPLSEDLLMLKLEQHSIALQKKETGERNINDY
jgi:hypothetical protein